MPKNLLRLVRRSAEDFEGLRKRAQKHPAASLLVLRELLSGFGMDRRVFRGSGVHG